MVDAAFARDWMLELADAIAASKDRLTQLDAAIGDADHGANLHRGFTAVRAKLDALEQPPTPGAVLTLAGNTLVSTVGGASGPLYGTALRRAGKALSDAPDVDAAELLEALRAALEGVQQLGAAAEGDKTMVDAFAPALDAFAAAVDGEGSLAAAAVAAHTAAEEGAAATVPLQARKGRASYLGPRSVGHQDPGATSTTLLFAALRTVAEAAEA